MHRRFVIASTVWVLVSAMPSVRAQSGAPAQGQAATAAPAALDPIKTMVDRLDLEKYKATIKGLTQFGDRRQGTDRNRQAVDWIEAQLKSYGCSSVERITCRRTQRPGTGENSIANGCWQGVAAGLQHLGDEERVTSGQSV